VFRHRGKRAVVPFSPHLPAASFFLSWSLKEELTSFKLGYKSLKNILEGVNMTTAAAMFAMAFRRLL
jgi:hypothetical protein